MSARPSYIQRLLLGLIACLLTACTTVSSSQVIMPPATSTAASPSGTLLLWHGWSGAERQILGRLVEQFNRRNPYGRISLQSIPLAGFERDLRAAAAAGSGPHLMLVPNTWLGTLVDDRVVMPLDELIPADARTNLLPVTLISAQVRSSDGDDALYGLPIRFDTLALFYNSANLLSAPVDTATLLAAARGLSDTRTDPPMWGLALNLSLDTMIGYLYAFGGRVFDDSGRVVLASSGRTAAEQWLTWLQTLNNDAALLARVDSGITVDRELKNGRALMTFDWSYQLGTYRNLWGNTLGIAPLPRLTETNQAPRTYVRSDVLALNARMGPAEQKIAVEFLRFMSGPEAQQLLLLNGIQPSLRSVPLEGDSAVISAARAFRAQALNGIPMPNSSRRAVVDEELRVMIRQVLLGLTSPADAVTTADERVRRRLGLP